MRVVGLVCAATEKKVRILSLRTHTTTYIGNNNILESFQCFQRILKMAKANAIGM